MLAGGNGDSGVGERLPDDYVRDQVGCQRIVEYRQMASFQALEDIMNVKGIGDKTYQKILPYICL